jgi:hypothetical protein
MTRVGLLIPIIALLGACGETETGRQNCEFISS